MIGLDIVLVYGFIYLFFGQTLIYSEYERTDKLKENKPPKYSP